MSYSLPLAQHLVESGVELYGRSDLRFVEGLYKVNTSYTTLCLYLIVLCGCPPVFQVMRDTLQYRPQLTKEQFLSPGFAERKIIMTFELLQLCQTKHHQLDGVRTCQKRRKTTIHSGSSMSQRLTSSGHTGVRVCPDNRLVTSESMGFLVPLPPSPPPSPLQTPSPTTLHGIPLLCGAGELELTPCSTPLKPGQLPVDLTCSSNHCHNELSVQVVREPVLTADCIGEDEEESQAQNMPPHESPVLHSGEQNQGSKGILCS